MSCLKIDSLFSIMIEINSNIRIYTSPKNLVNSTIYSADDIYIVIDTQLFPEDILNLKDSFEGEKCDYIINTHYHSDHCYGNPTLKSENTKTIARKNCIETLLRERNMIRSHRAISEKKLKVELPDIEFEDEYSLDDCGIRIIHSPGHSPDSSVVLLKNENVLIAGDSVLNGPGVTIPYYYWDNPYLLLDSLKRLKELEFETIVPGHGKPVKKDFLDLGISYLENSISLSEYIFSVDSDISLEDLKNEITIESVLSGITEKDLWVPKMHNLNLQRMFMLMKADL